eukprot:scaffold3466_cov28-Tisochrysis_lutea.AAC.1
MVIWRATNVSRAALASILSASCFKKGFRASGVPSGTPSIVRYWSLAIQLYFRISLGGLWRICEPIRMPLSHSRVDT